MKIYAVGGVIRDRLLGLPTKDIDYVVVGSSPQEMIALGYTPVGSDFPVFLHPQTKAEYALARTERKVAKGYKGFDFYADPSVTLEQDLLRRDLTINAMAQAVDEHGQLVGDIIDPYGGQDDLRQKVFRHVSEAFEEDPLRLLRLARFAARFDGFHVHPETLKLLRKIVANQELDALVVERVWQELAKLLMGQTPSNGLKILRDCGVLKYFFGLDEQASNINDALNLIDASASAQHVLAQRVAAIFIGMPHHASSWALRWKVPNECKEYATHIGHVLDLTMLIQSPPIVANNILDLIDRVDFWRKPDRFHQLIAVVALTQVPTNKLDKLTLELKALDLSTALQGGLSGAQIKEQIDRIRLEKIQQFFAS